jgi:hypothetical protein
MIISRLLVRHPKILEKLRKEIYNVLGQTNSPTREQIRKMPYLANVIKESMLKTFYIISI